MRVFHVLIVALLLALVNSLTRVVHTIPGKLSANHATQLPANDAIDLISMNGFEVSNATMPGVQNLVSFKLRRAIIQYFKGVFAPIGDHITQAVNNLWESAYMTYLSMSTLFGGDTLVEPVAAEEPQCSVTTTGNLSWAGTAATPLELFTVSTLRARIHAIIKAGGAHRWYSKATDIELLRFLRAQDGDIDRTWQQLQAHVEWRSSAYGADSSFTRNSFINSPLHHEVFWLGLNTEGIPTMVIRTQVHDLIYYNHDPAVYESFIVSMIEKGRKLFGVGSQRQMCILIDRGGIVRRNGVIKVETRDMTVVPHIAEIVRCIVATVQNNYPDLLHSVKVAPASWFFTMCYKITSAVLDATTREKFEFLHDRDVSKLHAFLSPELLPAHLGGTSTVYRSLLDIEFHGDCL